jgi:hypothetical protein
MKKLLIGLALIFCASLNAQRSSTNDYWNSWRYTPKQDKTAEFEEAVAKKMQLYNNNAATGIMTYKVITGRNSGTYERVESMKYAKDYDVDRTAEGEYWQKNVAKFVDRTSGQIRWDRINNATMNWDPENPGTPSKYLERTTYDVKPSGIMHFRRFMYRVTKTMEKRGVEGTQLMFRCISGGSDNMFVVVRGWDKYERSPTPEQENNFMEDYDELFGWRSFIEDQENFNDALENWGEMTETMQLVPSLTTGMMN